MNNKKLNQNESGRSMVEMLGVLAVMGLLTIIGIAGFKIAMNKAKANNLVADMNRLAHIVVMDKFSGYSEEAIENAVTEHNQKTEYQAEYEYRTPQVFAIKTKNAIDKTLCQQVANLGWQLPLATYLNKVKVEGTFDADSCADENELIWAFTNDLSACSDCALGDFDCTPYADRECGTCDSIGYTPKNEDCANNANGHYCVNGKCQECDVNQFWARNNNTCEECVDDSNRDGYPTTMEYIHACLGTMFRNEYNGERLLGCHISYYNVSSEAISCKACPNRCYNPDDQICYLAGENRLYSRKSDTDGTCVCNNLVEGACKCPADYFWNRDNNTCAECYNDASSTPYGTNADYIHACLGKMLVNYYEGGGSPRFFGCLMSRWESVAYSEPVSCEACTDSEGVKNRCYKPDEQRCYLAGPGKTYRRASDDDGTCVAN